MVGFRTVTSLLSLAVVAVFVSRTKCEIFTALVDMEHLIYREREMMAALRDYVLAEESKLTQLKSFLEKLEDTHALVGEDVSSFLGHPVNSYSLIKRYYKDWPTLEYDIQRDNTEGMSYYLDRAKAHVPLDTVK